jgi:aminoacyl tRNA synthase complex-interacting multifunctional protein 1
MVMCHPTLSVMQFALQVCAGLKAFYKKEELLNALVTVVLNLKPAKLAGQLSECMVLAADSTGPNGLVVKTLVPPVGSEPGDAVYLEGGEPTQAPAKVLKSDDWKAIVAGLTVKCSRATFEGTAFVTARGPVTLPAEIPDGAGIH